MSGVLDGVRVVDLTSGLAGSVATLLLAEVGADVVKVEPPSGDPLRVEHPAAFATWNRSKRSVVLDLDRESDRLHELLAGADVLVHGLTPAAARARGLDDATLAQRYPSLVVSAVTGFPSQHPQAEEPAEELLVQARSGVMDEQRGHRLGPVVLRFPIASWATAYLAATGVVVRLLVRAQTGRAGVAHTSLFQGVMAELAIVWNRAEKPNDFMMAKIPLPRDRNFVALTLFECQDGVWIQTLGGFMENPLVIETIAMMGEEYVVVPFGVMPTPEQRELWERMFLTRPSSEWIRAFHDGDVPAELVNRLGQVFADPDAALNGYAVQVDDPQWGRVTQTGMPFQLDPPVRVLRPAPAAGGSELPGWDPVPLPAASAAYPDQPLAGLKVLDLGMYLAGPFAPQLLADLGAEVIKVEAPTGDRMRRPGSEIMFVACQRGKRSLAIDLKDPAARAAFEVLVREADVVHHNLRMPAARALGVDEESVRAINPDLVYTHVSAYGTQGRRADFPGYDPISQAISGFMVEGAGAGNPPMWTRFGMMDKNAALASLYATVVALYGKHRTGRGTRVDVSLLGVAAMVNSETMLLPDGTVADAPHLDAAQRLLAPGHGIYPTADGWVAVVARGAAQLESLHEAFGADGHDALEARLRESTSDVVVAALGDRGVPCAPVALDHEQAYFDDPQLRANGLTVAYEHPVYGRLEQPGAAWDFGDLGQVFERPPPTLGQHTREVLLELGLSQEEVKTLHDKGLITVDGGSA